MGKLKQMMIEEMDMARENGDLMGDGVMFTSHPTDHLEFEEIGAFVERLRQYYELMDREIIAVNSYHNTGINWLSQEREKPDEHGIEIQWMERNVDMNKESANGSA